MLILWDYEFISEEDVVDVNIVGYEFVRRGCCRC